MPRSSKSSGADDPNFRLPVNPRRKKVAPEQRKRVALACNNCNVKRIKCSGEKPCRQCTQAQRQCIYPQGVKKVTVPQTYIDGLLGKIAKYESQLQITSKAAGGNGNGNSKIDLSGLLQPLQAVQEGDQGGMSIDSPDGVGAAGQAYLTEGSVTSTTSHYDYPVHAHNHNFEPAFSIDEDTEMQMDYPVDDGRMLADAEGTARYLGETSGATFLDSLKAFIKTTQPLASKGLSPNPETPDGSRNATFLNSVGRYQTFDSRPLLLPTMDVEPRIPTQLEIQAMITQFKTFLQDDNGKAGCGGIFFWPFQDPAKMALPDQSGFGTGFKLDTTKPRNHTAREHGQLALVYTAFAFTHLLTLTEENSRVDGQLGEAHYAAARMLIGNPLDMTSYTIYNVAVLALMALYLVENNRRDAAYMAISNAMHLSVMHGVHRESSVTEVERRTFWTVYNIDRWLSCLMGRPPAVPHQAITLSLPQEAPGLPSPLGLCAHVELSKISAYIVNNSYRHHANKPADGFDELPFSVAIGKLDQWHENLPKSLKLENLEESPSNYYYYALQPEAEDPALGTDRALLSLHMAYNQLIILAIRPAFLTAVKKKVANTWLTPGLEGPGAEPENPWTRAIRKCSDAARRNLRIGRRLQIISPGQKLLVQDLHHIFNAAIILLMHQILFVNQRVYDMFLIDKAKEVFKNEAMTGSDYGKDCHNVLNDLKPLVDKLHEVIHRKEHEQLSVPTEKQQSGSVHSPVNRETTPGALSGPITGSPTKPYPSHVQGWLQNVRPEDGTTVVQELKTWQDDDGMQVYRPGNSLA
ncbi:hypothetical protein GE21DRAFT_8551 [Neurospora crassa]|uniref:BEAK-2 n=1 Tax=Neurospora crassa (strain ATCC 24698 / 74-OR23-1A / CBS 708.71 / DSM 1257 / FGSC 987) TaxID=367110 RepID=Q7S6B3_NEUCR|nr:BEAK-2 [Neurospora crassa OR74A]EAA31086.2 BEAK-2 [Neurospora crassa OR74A]KHE86777.1 hypothetical protein GE21DRAFT_8551 [Neurospora crassa]|eukprot:XP_960322.2 BEAK-2 [Neurospora crassa OR74A]